MVRHVVMTTGARLPTYSSDTGILCDTFVINLRVSIASLPAPLKLLLCIRAYLLLTHYHRIYRMALSTKVTQREYRPSPNDILQPNYQ
jgi:hypothetical protein